MLAKQPRRTTNQGVHSENASLVRERLSNSESSTHLRTHKRPCRTSVVPHREDDDISDSNPSSDEGDSDASENTDTDSSSSQHASSSSLLPDRNDIVSATLTTVRGRGHGRRRGCCGGTLAGRGRG